MAVGAVALAIALGALVATDADGASKPAWVATGVAGLLVALGPVARSSTPVHAAVALLGAVLLLRQDARLVLAPVYGAGLLLVAELGTRSIELREVRRVGPAVLSARAASAVAVVGLSACAAAGVAAAVTVAPVRSVAFTAVGAIAAVAMFAAIAYLARRRGRTIVGTDAGPGASGDHPGGSDGRHSSC